MPTEVETLSFLNLMKQIDEEERAQRDRGTLFELLTKAYLENEPVYRQLFDSVWLLRDVPEKYGIPKKDTGVDLVAKKRNSEELFAIQSKYYSPDYKIGKSDIDSFLNEVGKSYYSEGIIITSTPHWTNNAESALRDRDKNIARIDLTQLQESRVDWTQFSFSKPEKVELHTAKNPRPHQNEAIESVIEGFESADRGKLIMAPGTGKTFTSMVIAEKLAEKKEGTFKVLYLVPSIQLLSQALKGWSADSKNTMDTIAVCSDRKVTKQTGNTELEDIAAADIGYPATTNYQKLLKYQEDIESTSSKGDMLVVFSTYQSIDVTIEAQKHGFYEFDLVIADEAHRTTGATLSGENDSHFVKVHKNSNVKATKRLYQTATPRIYGESAHQKADEKSVLLYDMDNEELYGEELFYLGFGEAVHRGILSDYKVMVLAVDEGMVQKEMQHVFADQNNELQFDDVTKIIGTWNGLLKRKSNSNELYGEPMKRAIAFTGTIQKSKDITKMYQYIINEFVDNDDASNAYKVEIQHADGSMNALEKNQKIDWLKAEVPENSVKILSNARFLTEGVDVPDLDAVLFLQPRRSEIDIAQAVGRVMRKSDNKEYGYVILPIGVPEGVSANQVLDDNEKYAVVWDILNALRSIDERFDAMINKLELNKKKPDKINVIGIGEAPEVNDETRDYVVDDKTEQLELNLDENWTELEHAIYGRIVQKVGTTRYWETWSKDVAKIAEQHFTRISALLDENKKVKQAFNEFINGLKNNINSSISIPETIEMLAQHLITRPVFDSLFEEETFALNNPISQAMTNMIDILVDYGFEREQEELSGFYESVHLRTEGIDNLEAKQTIIIQLYEKFFKVGFPNTTDRLGIVFTPIEVVDFIIQSVEDASNKYLGASLNDKNVNILDPFTGTGTFITRLLQSEIISKENLLYKYTNEIYANEIVLLSYYIAAINIEETFKEISGTENYELFPGIVLTDTFESTEHEATLDDTIFSDNNIRLKKQQEAPITVIIGNPPYSVGQTNANDNNQNVVHSKLQKRIKDTYGKYSSSTSTRTLHDTYIKAYRWASDRLVGSGVVGFITPNSIIDKTTMDGFRKVISDEFNHIYILNLRGAIKAKIGEAAKIEGGNIFDIMTGVCITLLVKDDSNDSCIYYYQTEDYLSKENKLELLKENTLDTIPWRSITPDKNHDWINQRDENYYKNPTLDNDIFYEMSIGVTTNRDNWIYGFNEDKVDYNTELMISNYNNEIERLEDVQTDEEKLELLTNDRDKIKWSATLKRKFLKNEKIDLNKNIIQSMYRPFTKKWLYYDKDVIERPRQFSRYWGDSNIAIAVSGKGSRKGFSVLAVDSIPSMDMLEKCRVYNKDNFYEEGLFDSETSNINSNFIIKNNFENENEVFAYLYGLLNSKDYQNKYENDLLKDVPRIPKLANANEFVSIGKKLLELHLKYEKVEPYKDITIEKSVEKPSYKVDKLRFGKGNDKTIIIFNKDITIKNIPKKAYEYVVNGRSAIEWILDQYRVVTDKASGIVDDPNEYSDDPRYILNLLLSIINVSVQTVDLINSLPPLDIIQE